MTNIGLKGRFWLARDSETLTELVVYRALYDSDEFGPNALWAPLSGVNSA